MSVTLDGIYVDGQKATFHPEDILTGDTSAYTEEIGESVTAWLDENVTSGEQVTDTTLTLSGVPADAKVTGDEITSLKEDFELYIGVIDYYGGVQTINADASVDTSKKYVCTYPNSNYGKLMVYNASTSQWEYSGFVEPLVDKATDDELNKLKNHLENISSSTTVTGIIENKVVEAVTNKIIDNSYCRMAFFEVGSNKTYTIVAIGNMNRMILYASDDGITYTEVQRYASDHVPSPAILTFNNTNYTHIAVSLYYGQNSESFKGCCYVKDSTDSSNVYTIQGTPLVLKSEISDNITVSFVNGWINVATGQLSTSQNRARTEKIFIPKGSCLIINPSGYYYQIGMYDASGQYTGTYYNDWESNQTLRTHYFTDDVYCIIGIKNSDNSDVDVSDIPVSMVKYTVNAFETMKSAIQNITNYATNKCDIINATVNNNVIVQSDSGRLARIPVEGDKYYHISVSGEANRFILFGLYLENNQEILTEVFRYPNGQVPNPAYYTYHADGTYDELILALSYGVENPKIICKYATFEEDGFDTIEIKNTAVPTKEIFDKELEQQKANIKANTYKLRLTTMDLPLEIDAQFENHLYLIGQKMDNQDGIMPIVSGYLYLDMADQKMYYSSICFNRPEYLCDWNSSIADNRKCEDYFPIITKEGDIIFIVRPFYYNGTQRFNPIIYPHGDYSNPYVIDFGNDIKPKGTSTGLAFDYCCSKDYFMFGEYAIWDENDDGSLLYIWKVEKPYNTPECWHRVFSQYRRHYNHTPGITGHEGEEIGHWHTVSYDFYSDAWIASSGDIDDQIKTFMSKDDGATWVNQNSLFGQASRTVNYVYTKDAVYYQTDSNAVLYNYTHALFKVERGIDGYPDFSTQSKVIDLPSQEAAGYGVALVREPYGLLLIDRIEVSSLDQVPERLPIVFYDLRRNEVFVLDEIRPIDDYDLIDNTTRYGMPAYAGTYYQSPYETGIILGATANRKAFGLDVLGNNKYKLVGVVKFEIT